MSSNVDRGTNPKLMTWARRLFSAPSHFPTATFSDFRALSDLFEEDCFEGLDSVIY
jgi:hypothetical protein